MNIGSKVPEGIKLMNDNKESKRYRNLVAISLTIFVAIVLFDISPFGGNTRFYVTWINCGQKPVAIDASSETQVLHYVEPSAMQPVRLGQPQYFCTPLEAEQAGYSASPIEYSFPHLQQGA